MTGRPAERHDGQNWKRQLDQAQTITSRRDGQKPRRHVTLALHAGDVVWYTPRKMTAPHAGQQATVTRAPKPGVQSPSVRLEFKDGEQRTVPVAHVARHAPRTDPAPLVEDARRLPSWKRLVDLMAFDDPATQQQAENRARQIAGLVAPRAQRRTLSADLTATLLDAARADHAAALARRAGRNGKPAAPAIHGPIPTEDAARAHLDQEQRAMINRIALSIHRRYLLSDKELRALTEDDREKLKIHGILRQVIGLGERESGLPHTTSATGPSKGNTLYGELHEHLLEANRLALDACTALLAGQDDHALTLAMQVREHRLHYLAAQRATQQRRVKHGTGRFFHGDILSVRHEHVHLDENGNFDGYSGMTQYYARLIVLYGPDGHTLDIANADELEAITATRAGPQAWASLCRWIVDLSERADGRRAGRRQDDDEHLIYRENDGHLRLRQDVEARFPGLLAALEVIRRALHVALPQQDITVPELGEAPAPGYHPPLQDAPGAEKIQN